MNDRILSLVGVAGAYVASAAAPREIGAIIFDPSAYAASAGAINRSIQFVACLETSDAASPAQLELVNFTDATSVVLLTTASTTPVIVSASLTVGSGTAQVPNGQRLYGLRLKTAGNGVVSCKTARIDLVYA
jgi:hypothetical protein